MLFVCTSRQPECPNIIYIIYTTSTSKSHSASYNIMCNHHYHHHHDHHSTNYNACIQYMCHCFRKKTTTTAITQCKLQYYSQPPLPPHHSTKQLLTTPQHKNQIVLLCLHNTLHLQRFLVPNLTVLQPLTKKYFRACSHCQCSPVKDIHQHDTLLYINVCMYCVIACPLHQHASTLLAWTPC